MGNQNKPTIQTNNKPDEKSSNKHHMFKDSRVTQDKNQNSFYQVSHSVANKNIYKNWMASIENFQKEVNNNQRFLLLPIESSYTQEGVCGSAGILKIIFDYYPFTLAQQIQNRHNLDQPFEEKQIWYLLFVLIETAHQFHCRNQIVGDIRPQNIFVNQNGDVTLYSLLALPDLQPNYIKTFIHKQITYLAPEAITDTQNGKQSPTYNQPLGQCFSIGLTLLDAVLLYNSNELYNKAFLFNEAKLKQLLKQFQSLGLSEPLTTIIDSLLRFNLQQRLSTSDILPYLKQYQQFICNLEQFQPGALSVNIQQKLKLKTKKPSSQGIHLTNSPQHSSQGLSRTHAFLQTTQLPVHLQNINSLNAGKNSLMPQKIYSFMDPSQNNYYANGQYLQTKNDKEASNKNNADSNTYFENRNKNKSQDIFMIQSNVNRLVGSKPYELEYASNVINYEQNKTPANNNFTGMKLKHVQSKDQKSIELKDNIDIQNQKQTQQKFKSNFLNDYAKQSKKLLQQYQKISYAEQLSEPNYTEQLSKPNFKVQSKTNNYNINQIPSYQNQKIWNETYSNKIQEGHQIRPGEYSFGTGHLSNNLASMGRITTSITPNIYSNHYQYARQIGQKRQTSQPNNSYDIKMQNYKIENNFNLQDKNKLSFQTGNHKMLNLQIEQRDEPFSYKLSSYGNYDKNKEEKNNFNLNKVGTANQSYYSSYNNLNSSYNNQSNSNNQNNSYNNQNPNYINSNYGNLNQNYNNLSSNNKNQYSDIFSAIDKQLEESRKLYPGS